MSPHFPVCNATDVVRVLKRNGFILLAQRGSHQKWRHTTAGHQVIVPMHGSKPIPVGTLHNIIKGSGLGVDLFR